jgi:hypothetical protein
MAFIPVPNAAQVHMSFLYDNQICENVFHVQGTAPLTVAQLTQVGNAFRDWWIGSIAGLVPQTLSLQRVEVIGLDAANSPGVVVSGGTLPAPGAHTQPQLPNNVTVAVRWLTAFRGRSFRGRTFHLGIAEDQVTGNTISGPLQSNLQSQYDNLPTTIGLAPFVLVVVSRFSNGQPRTQGISTAITSVSVDNVIDSQRRRLPGRGA